MVKFCTFQIESGEVVSGWLHREHWVVDMAVASEHRLPKMMRDFLVDADANLRVAQTVDRHLTQTLPSLNEVTEGEDIRGLEAGCKNVPDEMKVLGLHRLKDVKLLAPLPNPPSVRDFYAFEAHVKTARQNRGLDMIPQWYDFPVFYFTNHQAIVGPDEPVDIPSGCEWFDYELEMACVIGRKGRDIKASEASDYIFGFTIMNDWSARDVQREEMKVGLGPAKGKDFATSLGPWLVTADELIGPAGSLNSASAVGNRYHLAMRAFVNGKPLSQGNYADIYYTFEQMIERASAGVQLYPGDVIGSGTVGTGCILELGTAVHRWLQPGDVVELTIDGLGTLRNIVKG